MDRKSRGVTVWYGEGPLNHGIENLEGHCLASGGSAKPWDRKSRGSLFGMGRVR